jgi:hypothetical protein
MSSLQCGIKSTQRLHDALMVGFGGLVFLLVLGVIRLGVLVRRIGTVACFFMGGDLLLVIGDLCLMSADARFVAGEFLACSFEDGSGFLMICGPSGVIAFPGSVVELIAGVFSGGIRVHGGVGFNGFLVGRAL